MVEVSTITKIITPAESCFMGGYSMRTQKNDGVLDDLKCTVNVLRTDGIDSVWCDLELLMVAPEMAEEIKRKVQEKHGVAPELVTIAAIHTHAAPELRSKRLPVFCEGDWEFSKRYAEFVCGTVCAAVDECYEKGLTEVSAEYFTVNVQGYYGNRNGIDKPEDKDVTVIRFNAADGKTVAAAVNITCHPTVLGADNLKISGDLLGYISRSVREKLGVYPVMIQGAAGDMSNRNYRKGHDAAELKRTAEGVLMQVFSGKAYTPLELKAPTVKPYVYRCEYDLDMDEWTLRKKQLEEKLETLTEYDARKVVISSLSAVDLKMKDPHIKAEFPCSIISYGDLVICKTPGEMFSRFGVQIKNSCHAKLPIMWCYADHYAGYMADEGEYGVTYESMMSPLPKGATEYITEQLCKFISEA